METSWGLQILRQAACSLSKGNIGDRNRMKGHKEYTLHQHHLSFTTYMAKRFVKTCVFRMQIFCPKMSPHIHTIDWNFYHTTLKRKNNVPHNSKQRWGWTYQYIFLSRLLPPPPQSDTPGLSYPWLVRSPQLSRR